MRTTLNIDERLLAEVSELTGEKDRGKAINRVMKDFVRKSRLEELRALRGKIELVDNLEELKQLELEKMRKSDW